MYIVFLKVQEAQNEIKSVQDALIIDIFALKNQHEKNLSEVKSFEQEVQEKLKLWSKQLGSHEFRWSSSVDLRVLQDEIELYLKLLDDKEKILVARGSMNNSVAKMFDFEEASKPIRFERNCLGSIKTYRPPPVSLQARLVGDEIYSASKAITSGLWFLIFGVGLLVFGLGQFAFIIMCLLVRLAIFTRWIFRFVNSLSGTKSSHLEQMRKILPQPKSVHNSNEICKWKTLSTHTESLSLVNVPGDEQNIKLHKNL